MVFLWKLNLKCHFELVAGPLKMIKVDIEEPFLIGDIAKVLVNRNSIQINKIILVELLVWSWGIRIILTKMVQKWEGIFSNNAKYVWTHKGTK